MMGAPRRFNYAEARHLRAEGLTYAQIGKRLGVSDTAAQRACDPGYNKRQSVASKRAIEAMRVPCRGGCGVLVWMHQSGHSGYCPQCLGEKIREANGPNHGTESEYRAGCRCGLCLNAASAAKRRRRERSRVPCSHGCGRLVDSINRKNPTKPIECNPCALQRIRDERRMAVA